MAELVAVTGAAGKTGRAVVAALSRRGVRTRALVHRAEQAQQGVPGAAESVAADLGDADALATALDGVDAVYLIAPNMHPDEPGLARSVIQACAAKGLPRIVYHSVIHPYVPAMPHHVDKAKVEALLQESALDWTVLQPASYFENAYGVWDSVRDHGRWPLPYSAQAPFTPVALVDVAEVAAGTLTDSRHRFATYELAGPEVLSTADMAEIAGEVLGREVSVAVDRDPGVARPERLQAMFDYYDSHGICGNGTILAALLHRPPTTWRAWVDSHR
ncbi:MAG: NAD(P)H-binding protein [Nakamurella sp.]